MQVICHDSWMQNASLKLLEALCSVNWTVLPFILLTNSWQNSSTLTWAVKAEMMHRFVLVMFKWIGCGGSTFQRYEKASHFTSPDGFPPPFCGLMTPPYSATSQQLRVLELSFPTHYSKWLKPCAVRRNPRCVWSQLPTVKTSERYKSLSVY